MSDEITHPIPLEGETGYDWPCIKCGKLFTPRRLTRLKTSPMSKCCASCALDNLMKFILEPENDPK